MAKAAFRGRRERSLGAAGAVGALNLKGRESRSSPVDFHGPLRPPVMPLAPNFPISSLLQSPALDSGRCSGVGGTLQSGCKVGSDPAIGCGARPLQRVAAVLLGRRRAEKPFEMRGAADHWSPAWGWERAAALKGPRTLKGSPLRSDPPTALELARCWCRG